MGFCCRRCGYCFEAPASASAAPPCPACGSVETEKEEELSPDDLLEWEKGCHRGG